MSHLQGKILAPCHKLRGRDLAKRRPQLLVDGGELRLVSDHRVANVVERLAPRGLAGRVLVAL